MFKENGMFNVPVGINEHENLSKEKSTEELKAELLEYQKRMEEIVAELARREQGSVQESSDEELLHTQVAEMREAFSDENEGRAEEFDNQRSEELEEKITGDDFKKRTLEYLENAGVVKYKAGQVFFDMGIFESREFSEDLFKLFLGRKDGRDFKGNKKLVKEMFSDIKIHNLSAGGNKEKEYENLEQIKYDLYLEKIKNMFLDDLRKEGVLKEIEGVKIFDFDKFSQYKFKKNFGYIDNRAISANFSCIFDFLKDQELVSLQDYRELEKTIPKLKQNPYLMYQKA